MDPLTIVGTVISLIARSVATSKALYDLLSKFASAPTIILAMCSEASVISASLSQIQTLLLDKRESTEFFESRPELANVLDISLTGCNVVLSCLDEEIRRMSATPLQTIGLIKNRAKFVWNQDKLRDLLDSLRGQQTAINLLIQLLQMGSLEQIKQLIKKNKSTITETVERTHSLRISNPQLQISPSIFTSEDREGSVFSTQASIDAALERKFAFDAVLLNTDAYRRAFTSARMKAKKSTAQVVEGDLIDLSDTATMKHSGDQVEPIDGATLDLKGLAIHNGPTSNNPQSGSSLEKSPERNPDSVLSERILDEQLGDAFKPNSLSIHQYDTEEMKAFRKLQKLEETLGPEHPDTLRAVHGLGLTYIDQHRFAEAERQLERVLRGWEKVLGPEHPDTLLAAQSLGETYAKQGWLADAERQLEHALRGLEKALGPEHPDTLGTVHNLGLTYMDQGRLAAAERQLERALRAWEKSLGPEHRDTLCAAYNLGRTYLKQDRLADAERQLERALRGREKELGPEHPDTLYAAHNLGVTYMKQGKLDKAKPLLKRAKKRG